METQEQICHYNLCTTSKMWTAFQGKSNSGKEPRSIMVVLGHPGLYEELKQQSFTGEETEFFKSTIGVLGINPFEDVNFCYAVQCRPKHNIDPNKKQITACRQFLKKAIEETKPEIVILAGETAVHSVIGARWKKDIGSIHKWRGCLIPDQFFRTLLCPVFSYNDIFSAKNPEIFESIFRKDMHSILTTDKRFVEAVPPKINLLFSPTDIHAMFDSIPDRAQVAFDYETTGLKPYSWGHEIVTCALCWDESATYAFPMKEPSVKKRMVEFLKGGNPKIGANLHFEEMWSRQILGTPVNNWGWDTVLSAHVLNNFPGICSVKFQAYVNFGVEDYSESVSKFLESDSSLGMNRIKSIPVEQLLEYNALDAFYEYKIAMLQQDMIEGA